MIKTTIQLSVLCLVNLKCLLIKWCVSFPLIKLIGKICEILFFKSSVLSLSKRNWFHIHSFICVLVYLTKNSVEKQWSNILMSIRGTLADLMTITELFMKEMILVLVKKNLSIKWFGNENGNIFFIWIT